MKTFRSLWSKGVGKDKLIDIVGAWPSPPGMVSRLEADGPEIST